MPLTLSFWLNPLPFFLSHLQEVEQLFPTLDGREGEA